MDQVELVGQRRRADLANAIQGTFLAVAAGQGSEEAGAEIERVIHELVPETDDSLAHLTNPNAETDWDALHGLAGSGAPFGFSRVRQEEPHVAAAESA